MTKALTGPQPRLSLAAAGVVTVWTVAHPTDHRGHVALHAAKRRWDRSEFARLAEVLYVGGRNGPELRYRHPLGAVVGSAVITDCVPIIEWRDAANNVGREVNTGERWRHPVDPPDDLPMPRLKVDRGVSQWRSLTVQYPGGVNTIIGDQLPFGDFTPGRWALLLDDPAPTTRRCPWCWGESHSGNDRLTEVETGATSVADGVLHAYIVCPVCDGEGVCDPVPARGHPGLWNWNST